MQKVPIDSQVVHPPNTPLRTQSSGFLEERLKSPKDFTLATPSQMNDLSTGLSCECQDVNRIANPRILKG